MGLLNAIKAKLGSESAQMEVEKERSAREKQAFQKRTDRETTIARGKARGELSDSSAQRLREVAARKEQIEAQLPRERVAADIKKVGSKLQKGVSRIADNVAKNQQKKPSGSLREERTTTDKSGRTTTIRTYHAPQKQSQPRGRPRSYHAPRGGFKAPSYGSGGGMPRMPPMNFDMGFGTSPKKKQKGGKKSPLDPFNFDMDF
jgi:hypothetical protein